MQVHSLHLEEIATIYVTKKGKTRKDIQARKAASSPQKGYIKA